MAVKTLHPKIQALRNSIGHIPIHYFMPSRKAYESLPEEKKMVRESSGDDREIKQYFAIWGVPDDYGTQPVKGCFAKSISERGPGSSAPNKIVVLNQHDQKCPLCLPTELLEDEIGLYGRYTPDPDIEENDTLVKRVKRGTINGGSYGFNYVWDKMEYDDKTDTIMMIDTILYEVSPVTIPSQLGTKVIRSVRGGVDDKFLEEETEELIKQLPRKYHLELRSLISRHISLAKTQPNKQSRNSLKTSKPKQRGEIDYSYLISALK